MEELIKNWKEKSQPFELNYWKIKGLKDYSDNYNFYRWWIKIRDWIGEENIKGVLLDIGSGVRPPLEKGNVIEPLGKEYKEIAISGWWKEIILYPYEAERFIQELEGKCDFILCWNSIDHGYNFRDALKNIKAYLKDGGIVALATDCKTIPFKNGHPILGVNTEEFVKIIEQDFQVIKKSENLFERDICLLLMKKT